MPILPFKNPDWEKLAIFLRFLVHKLPSPDDSDLAAGVLDAIDMDSYRVEKKAMLGLMKDHTQLYKLYANNQDFKQALSAALFRVTMGDEAA